MKNGITFNGVHSSTFEGVTVKTRDRPIMPAPKMAAYEADNMNGDIDFTDYTGLTYYQNRTVTVDFQIVADSLGDLQNKMNSLMLWLRGKGEIIFDDIPMVKWIGRVSDNVSYMPERGKTAVLTVSFLCEPFTQWASEADSVALGDNIRLRARVPIGMSSLQSLTANEAATVFIMGDVPAFPVFEQVKTGTWTVSVTNSLGTKSFACSYDGGEVVWVNCNTKETYSIIYVGMMPMIPVKTNRMTYMTGDFPILMPNEPNYIVSTLDAVMSYTPKYFYNGGMS